MRTTREVMESLYLRGGEFCDEAREWLIADDTDSDIFDCIEDALVDVECGDVSADRALYRIAHLIGYEIVLTDDTERSGGRVTAERMPVNAEA